jgi:putative oxidoreductase
MALVTSIGLLILRLTLAVVFLAHGAQKLFGSFSGPGLTGTSGMMEQLKLRPAWFWALVAGLGEFVGGLLLALGLLMPLGALLVCGVMLVAIARVHWHKGFWASRGGIEYNLALAASSVALGLIGPGRLSLDALFGIAAPEPQAFVISFCVMLALLLAAVPVGNWLVAHYQGLGEQRPVGRWRRPFAGPPSQA